MKKRLHDKKAGVAILCVLLILSLAEVVGDLILNTEFAEFNLGEPFATLVFATMILFFGHKKKDRICYIWTVPKKTDNRKKAPPVVE